MAFQATLELGGKTATGVAVPAEVLDGLGGGRRPAVQVTINGYTYRTTVGSVDGRAMVPVSAEVRAAAGVVAGEVVTVDLTLDTAPRTVEVPDDLSAALGQSAAVRTAFHALSYSSQRRHVLSVEAAKTAETRQRRIDKVVAELTTG